VLPRCRRPAQYIRTNSDSLHILNEPIQIGHLAISPGIRMSGRIGVCGCTSSANLYGSFSSGVFSFCTTPRCRSSVSGSGSGSHAVGFHPSVKSRRRRTFQNSVRSKLCAFRSVAEASRLDVASLACSLRNIRCSKRWAKPFCDFSFFDLRGTRDSPLRRCFVIS